MVTLYSLNPIGILDAQNEARKTDVRENVGENVGEGSIEEKLIALISDNPHISQREMAAAIGKTTKTVERIIKSSKRIKRSSPDRVIN